ncbi:hypothetical protein NE865_08208 [Phthorimaea operculella]|nr:hypothetical protein NE865_08208 [Phthorimaea operculella]
MATGSFYSKVQRRHSGVKKLKNSARTETKQITSKSTTAQNNNTLTILHQNVRSITSKTILLDLMLSKHDPDVLICSETWCKSTEIVKVQLKNYVLSNAFSRLTYGHGGVALFTRSGISYKKRPDLQQLAIEYDFDFSAIELLESKIIVIGMYRTGNGDFENFLLTLESLLNSIIGENKRFILVGDTNVNFLEDSPERTKLIDLLNSYDSQNIVNFPTRVTSSRSSCLDCGIVSCNDSDLVTVQQIDTPVSDHNAQLFFIPTAQANYTANRYMEKRLFTENSIHNFYIDIANYEWNFIHFDININDKFTKLITILKHFIDIHFPIKKVLIKKKFSSPSWLSAEVAEYINKFESFCLIKRQYPENETINKCGEHYSGLIKSASLRDKRNYISNKLQNTKNPSKEVWNVVNSEIHFPSEKSKHLGFSCFWPN